VSQQPRDAVGEHSRGTGSDEWFEGLSPSDCKPLTANATDSLVTFTSGATLAGAVGKDAVLNIKVKVGAADGCCAAGCTIS